MISYLFPLVLLCSQVPVPTVQEIEGHIQSQRLGIVSGKIEARSWIYVRTRGTTPTTQYHSWFDNEAIRVDRLGPDREIRCFSGYDEQCIYYNSRGGLNMAANIVGYEALPEKDQQYGYLPLDPRLAGIVPSLFGNLVYYDLNYLVGRTDRDKPVIKAARLAEQDCFEVSFTTTNHVHVRYWVAPDQGFNVVRCEFTTGADPRKTVDAVDSELLKIPNTKIWFPRKCHYSSSIGGKPVKFEDVEFTLSHINESIDRRTFSLSAMDLPKGQSLSVVPDTGTGEKIWNGEAIIAAPEVAQRSRIRERPWLRSFLLLNMIGLILVSGYYGWRTLKHKRKSPT